MLPKPPQCTGCSLYQRGLGYVPADGPPAAPILLVGESAGADEIYQGRPFVGAAGSMLSRILTRNHWTREQFRIDNVTRCRPPHDFLRPYLHTAVPHCRQYLDQTLAEGHPIVVALGQTALRSLLNLSGKGVRIQDFHGTVTRDPTNRFWVVPTFHPSHLQRGATNLIGTVSFDLQVANQVATQGWVPDTPTLICDPDIAWFEQWVNQVVSAAIADPEGVWLSTDCETPDKDSGQDEGELSGQDQSWTITRVNLCVRDDEAVTVPFVGPYIPLITRVHAAPCVKLLWNADYDRPRYEAAGVGLQGQVWDLMWLWHKVQSDLPRGLGFVAPFYSRYGAWKHLATTEPAKYGCLDGLQNQRIGLGLVKDAVDLGFWPTFERHVRQLWEYVLAPAREVGIQVNRERLEAYRKDLDIKARRILHEIQGCVPPELRPLTPPKGYKVQPVEGKLHQKAKLDKGSQERTSKQDLYHQTSVLIEKLVLQEVKVCQTCGQVDVHTKHRCQDKTLVPLVHVQVATVRRWYWREPFNPDSPQQVLAYIKAKNHAPGKAKKSIDPETGERKETTNRETLKRLARTTKDPLYTKLLESRAVGKIKGTYAEGTLKRLDARDRLHPTATFKPSTGRLSFVNPNITNVVGKRAGDLASGFKESIVASEGCRLLETDFSAIEAVQVGWWANDPDYIKLAWKGVHAGLASHVLGRPYDPSWPDADIVRYFKEIKSNEYEVYDRSKHCTHGISYGLTEYGMVENFPDTFPTLAIAKKYKAIFYAMAPNIPRWQNSVCDFAAQHDYLGGPGLHPFGDKHWFFSVYGYRRVTLAQAMRMTARAKKQGRPVPVTQINGIWYRVSLGEDGKRCLPLSTKVWMGDYTYKALGDVRVGDTVIGWERQTGPAIPSAGTTASVYATRSKSFRTDKLTRALVTDVHRLRESTLTIRLASGQEIRCTGDHQWLCLRRHEYIYLQAAKMRVGDQVCRIDVTDPGDCPPSLRETAAWLGGFYDGEGSHQGIVQSTDNHGLLERAEDAFHALGFSTARHYMSRHQRGWTTACFLRWLGGRQEALRFRRWVPSWRYPAQWADRIILSSRFRRLDRIIAITHNRQVEDVACITTTTGNFIADGLCSHNCIAFYPQSSAAGVLKEAMLGLFHPESPDYIGDAYFGKTPLRAPIHDSLLLEIPLRQWDRVVEAVCRVMRRPIVQQPCPVEWGIGPYLTVGIEATAGQDWYHMEDLPLPDTVTSVGGDTLKWAALDEEQEDLEEFGTVA